MLIRLLIVTLCLLAASASAHADDKSAATTLLEQAEDAFVNDEDCARALPLFEGAYRLKPSWIALSGMAACRELQDQPELAYRLYARMLRDFGGELPAKKRQRVEARIAALAPRLGTLRLSVRPAGTRLSVDGEPIEANELPLPLAPGIHRLRLSAPDHRDDDRTFEIQAGQVVELDVTLAPIVDVLPLPPAPAPRPVPRARSPWIWRSLALSGTALAAGGATLLVYAQRDFDAFDASVTGAPGSPALPVDADDARLADGREKRTIGVVLVGVGASALVGALFVKLWPVPTPSIDVPAGGGVSLGMTWSY